MIYVTPSVETGALLPQYMLPNALSDIDELVLSCRSEAARSYLSEAAACYKAGAYRSTIIATWIAVLFDFIHKLRELEMTGDKGAKQKLTSFDAARQSGDIKASLEFERTLVEAARDEFQLISAVEAVDLQRLFDDRNRCAHSSMISTDEPYQPTAELARAHMKNAVVALLQHPPVQGQAALDRIWADIKSEYFPADVHKAVEFLKDGPLGKARHPVVRSVVIGLTKDLVMQRRPQAERARQLGALGAALLLYPAVAHAVLHDKLPTIVQGVPDEMFDLVIRYLSHIEPAWNLVGVSSQMRAKAYVESGPTETMNKFVPQALNVPALREIALKRLADIDADMLARFIKTRPDPAFVEPAIAKFRASGAFRVAEARLEQLVIPLAKELTPANVGQVIDAFNENDQISWAAGVSDLMLELLDSTEQIAADSKVHWSRLYASLLSHDYYKDERGQGLRDRLGTTFGFGR